MLKKIIITFFFLIVADLLLLIKMGSLVGAGNTITYLLTMALLGMILIKLLGWDLLVQAQSLLMGGHWEQSNLSQKLYYYLASFLFIIPGLLSDLLALLLIWPFSRKLIVSYYRGHSRSSHERQHKDIKIINLK